MTDQFEVGEAAARAPRLEPDDDLAHDARVQAVHQRLCARAQAVGSHIVALEEAAEEIVNLSADAEEAARAPREPLEPILARLRHAYQQLVAHDNRWSRRGMREFADGLIAPQIRKLEALAASRSALHHDLLTAWREQDRALQDIYGECGEDAPIGCPGDVFALVKRTLAELRATAARAPEPDLARRVASLIAKWKRVYEDRRREADTDQHLQIAQGELDIRIQDADMMVRAARAGAEAPRPSTTNDEDNDLSRCQPSDGE